MGTIYDDYELKEPQNIQKWQDALSDKLACAKKSFHPSFDGLLSRFKKVFGITPMALKSGSSKEARYLREFTLYLLVHYTDDNKKIADTFCVSQSLLKTIKEDATLMEKYQSQEELFFEELISDALNNLYANLALSESIQKNTIDQQ
ncbi:MAG: hypothetical protein WC667_13025 [Sulfurimonas sp.]|jgi:hypothetical protein